MGQSLKIPSLFARPLLPILRFLFRLWRKLNRECNPRQWSNDELKKFAGLFHGDVINVSAGEDEDKEGGRYQGYFNKASSYTTSNYEKNQKDRGSTKFVGLDLSSPLPLESDLTLRFDVVFSHTVLEHIYELETAIGNLCRMTRDIVITVVPFIQAFHHDEESYDDFWRISPYAIVQLFNNYNLKTIYLNWNNDPFGNIYLFHVASKYPENWENIITMQEYLLDQAGPGYYHQLILSNIKFTNKIPSGKIGAFLFKRRE